MLAVVVTGPGLVFFFALFAFAIYTAIDASKYPDWAFQRAGTQKWLFTVLTPIVGFLCGFVAIVLGILWFTSKKRQVDAMARGAGGPPEGTYGTSLPPPAPTWGPPTETGTWRPPPPPSGPVSPPPPGPAAPPPPHPVAPPPPDDPPGEVN
jgi:hypothetical protein